MRRRSFWEWLSDKIHNMTHSSTRRTVHEDDLDQFIVDLISGKRKDI